MYISSDFWLYRVNLGGTRSAVPQLRCKTWYCLTYIMLCYYDLKTDVVMKRNSFIGFQVVAAALARRRPGSEGGRSPGGSSQTSSGCHSRWVVITSEVVAILTDFVSWQLIYETWSTHKGSGRIWHEIRKKIVRCRKFLPFSDYRGIKRVSVRTTYKEIGGSFLESRATLNVIISRVNYKE